MNEKFTPEVIKINDSENAYYDEQGHLHMDGADYLEGFPDYEWFFATHKDNFPMLYKALSGDTEVHEDIAKVFMNYLEEKGTKSRKNNKVYVIFVNTGITNCRLRSISTH